LEKKQIEIEITDLAFDGKSVGYLDGKVVFLNGGLPGETVRAEITRSKPRYNQAIVHEIIRKSDQRVPAVCPHFDHCGGCTWQDLGYEHQLAYKKKQVVDCLQRLGKLGDVEVHDVIGSSELFNYRNKMEFSFHVAPDDSFTLGLHRRGRFDEIFNVEKCYLPQEIASEIVIWMRDYVSQKQIPIYNVFEHTGYMRFLMIRQAKNTDGLMINIVTNKGDFPDEESLVAQMTGTFPQITTIVHNQNGGKSNIATGEIEKVLYGPGYIEERLFDTTFRIRANSFFQTNTRQAETLYQTGFDMLQIDGSKRLLDLYCGTGSIGILLASRVAEVVGVELVPDAVTVARENAEVNNLTNISFFEGFVKDYLREYNQNSSAFDIVVVDPPRAGLHPKALKQLIELHPPTILHFSCNPATFARDAGKLTESGYFLKEVKPVDMFPHTMHIELATVFRAG